MSNPILYKNELLIRGSFLSREKNEIYLCSGITKNSVL